ncbi:50S ribosomal protein L14 [candidate division WWE3 bacterium]|nr:50S ribosomal protein L14 [candidate division WWE3 bacterium]
MIQVEATLRPADNSGAKLLKVLSIPGTSKKKYAYVGDEISVVVRGVDPSSSMVDGTKARAVIVRTAKERKRDDGSYVRFDDNAAVLIDKNGEPIGTRVMGPIAREVRDNGYKKVASLAKEVW